MAATSPDIDRPFLSGQRFGKLARTCQVTGFRVGANLGFKQSTGMTPELRVKKYSQSLQ